MADPLHQTTYRSSMEVMRDTFGDTAHEIIVPRCATIDEAVRILAQVIPMELQSTLESNQGNQVPPYDGYRDREAA